MDKELVSGDGYLSVGRGFSGLSFAETQAGTHRVHVGSTVTEGIKPAIGRRHLLVLTADEADRLADHLKRLASDVRFHEEQLAARAGS